MKLIENLKENSSQVLKEVEQGAELSLKQVYGHNNIPAVERKRNALIF
jgi:hypothetical protein